MFKFLRKTLCKKLRACETSFRRNGLNLSASIFNLIVRQNLNFHAYHIRIRHEFKDDDFDRKVNFSIWFIRQCQNANLLKRVVIGDEAAFHSTEL